MQFSNIEKTMVVILVIIVMSIMTSTYFFVEFINNYTQTVTITFYEKPVQSYTAGIFGVTTDGDFTKIHCKGGSAVIIRSSEIKDISIKEP